MTIATVVRIDTHVHTSPGSRCSSMGTGALLERAAGLGLKALCLTNHGDVADFDALGASGGLSVIPGVEISSPEGDFLVFSADLEFLRSLKAVQSLPAPADRPPETAVVWAHPFAGIPGGRGVDEGYLADVADRVDGIEVYNGNWPDDAASEYARSVADLYGLAELGGSDAHQEANLLRCWTEYEGEPDVRGLVAAIRRRRTRAFRRS